MDCPCWNWYWIVFYQYGLGSNNTVMTTSTIWGMTVFDGCWSLTFRGWKLWEPAGGIFTVFLGQHRSVGMQVRVVQCFWVQGMTPSHLWSHYLGQNPLSSVSSLPNTSSCGGLWVSLIRSKYYKDTPPKRFGIWKTRITPSTLTVGLQGMTSI